READIAMTELFGGFNFEFRASYEAHWPLDCGYKTRKHLYNCYHILNHLNLFGGSYAAQAENTINKLLSERNA
ncbi:MAG: fructosamine kinase family protein, partial [Gammaproteobacteria bacterium]|nr:fructosamine kinase family protein [Gammaproteobacteria bacterium]